MKDNYALSNKTKNLITIVNPQLKGYKGIEVALLYRINPCQEIDSSELVKEAFKQYYKEPIPSKADTIFNAFIPFMDFCCAKLIKQHKWIPQNKKEQYKLVYENLDMIFLKYGKLKRLFDRYFDLMYSFSNFMPAPIYFNGSENKRGKGTRELNKDYPYEYLRNLKDENSGIYMREEMYNWLNENLDTYRLRDMYSLKPPYPINEYYGYDDSKLQALMNFVERAITLIENRFTD